MAKVNNFPELSNDIRSFQASVYESGYNLALKYEEESVYFSENNGVIYVYITEVAAKFNKRPADWLRLKQTKEYLRIYSQVSRIPTKELFMVRKGGCDKKSQGTWLYKDVALEFARWLNPKFSIWCNNRIMELMFICKMRYMGLSVSINQHDTGEFVCGDDFVFDFNTDFMQEFFCFMKRYKMGMNGVRKRFKTYILSDSNIGLYKIGKSENIKDRIKSLSTGNVYINLVAYIDVDIERELHERFERKRLQGEWFRLSKEEIDEVIKEYGFVIAKTMYY